MCLLKKQHPIISRCTKGEQPATGEGLIGVCSVNEHVDENYRVEHSA